MLKLLPLVGLVSLTQAAYPVADLVKTLDQWTDISFGLYSGYLPINDT